MKSQNIKSLNLAISTVLATAGLVLVPISVNAAAASGTPATTSATTSTNDASKVQQIITRGNTEITRRLTTLGTLSASVNAATKLTPTDKTNLLSEINSEISGLTSLKTQLDATTDITSARASAQSIFSDYRVYALVVPKVALVKAADSQQTTETKLTDLATKLQTRLSAAQSSGKNVATLQSELSDMTSKTNAAQSVSSNIETTVAELQPSDYNSDHSILSGDRDQLKAAQANITAAITDAKNIISGLKAL